MTDAEKLAAVRKLCQQTVKDDETGQSSVAQFAAAILGDSRTDLGEKLAAIRKMCWTTIEQDRSVYAVARFAASILDLIGRQRDEGR
jgi:hypothetical protein